MTADWRVLWLKMVEFVVAVSFYSFVAFTLNTFEIGPMPGLDRYWPA